MTADGQAVTQQFTITFWGVRGSIPVSGAEFNMFGGDTICCEIMLDEHRIIVDAGSGLRRLGIAMATTNQLEASLLLTHLHLDHLIGLTAFEPIFLPAGVMTVQAPALIGSDLRSALGALLDEPFFPVSLEHMPGKVVCSCFTPGDTITAAGYRVRTVGLNHGIGASGYRFDHAGKALVIITDHEHSSDTPDPRLVDFCKDADLVVYDAMWDEIVDYTTHIGWGHSSWQAGIRLVKAANARRLACIHHAPANSDVVLSEREARLQANHPVAFFARQGDVVSLL